MLSRPKKVGAASKVATHGLAAPRGKLLGSPYQFALFVNKLQLWALAIQFLVICGLAATLAYQSNVPKKIPYFVYPTDKNNMRLIAYNSSDLTDTEKWQLTQNIVAEYIKKRERTFYYGTAGSVTREDAQFVRVYSTSAVFNQYQKLFQVSGGQPQTDGYKTLKRLALDARVFQRNVGIISVTRRNQRGEGDGIEYGYRIKALFTDVYIEGSSREQSLKEIYVDVELWLAFEDAPILTSYEDVSFTNPLGIKIVSYSVISDTNVVIAPEEILLIEDEEEKK